MLIYFNVNMIIVSNLIYFVNVIGKSSKIYLQCLHSGGKIKNPDHELNKNNKEKPFKRSLHFH